MNKEQIEDLINNIPHDSNKAIVRKWFEHNHLVSTETKVVGLTDKQVKDMIDSFIGYFCDDSATYEANEDWNRTEKYLTEAIKGYLSRQDFAVKEVPVGLTDEQIEVLSSIVRPYDDSNRIRNVITDYLKTQTFVQPQQFQPNWENAPKEAEYAELTFLYRDNSGTYLQKSSADIVASFSRPTPPAPIVEVGQVWRHIDMCFGVEVTNVESGIDFVFIEDTNLNSHVDDIRDFLAKFERVL